MKSRIIALIGAVFTVYGFILCIMSNLNLGVVLVALFGMITLCIGVFYSKIKRLTTIKFFKICKILFIVFLCAEVLLVSFIAIYGFVDNVNYHEDAVIVLGAGIRGDRVTLPLKMRLDKAIEYHHKNPDAFIVVTGGQGLQETVTEAYAMEKYLIQNGVEKNKIIKEEKATSTFENMTFSKEILDASFDGDYSVVVITNHFHIFRGAMMAKNTGFQNVTHMHAGLQWYNLMPCFLRESLAVIKMIVLG
ncbi:MAG: YdcF family protein [Ruminococcaceae bacterium]|nr:YdcF family protein [Oscillospiraceae bacterium]